MPLSTEKGIDEELLSITGGVEVDKIPDDEIEKLNKVLELYKNRWNKEFDDNVGAGINKKTQAQTCFSDFINQRIGLSGKRLFLSIEIVESETNKVALGDFDEASLTDDGLYMVTVKSVDKFFSSVAIRPFAVLPGARAKLEIDGASDRSLLLDPNDIFSITFVANEEVTKQ